MSSRKERRRARRRAERQMREAFDAAGAGNLELARKLSHRAVAAGVNPVLWLEHARILRRCGDDEGAEQALRRAIALAPSYAEAFAELAALQAARGKLVQAERLQRRVVELLPASDAARAALERYRAPREAPAPPGLELAGERQIAGPGRGLDGGGAGRGSGEAVAKDAAPATRACLDRTARYDWDAIAAALRLDGAAALAGLLSAAECADLVGLWDDLDRFEHETSEGDGDSATRCRYFAPPLPPLVAALRAELYARAAPIANRWQELLGRAERFPPQLDAFLARCHAAGQRRSTAMLGRCVEGDRRAPRPAPRGAVELPLLAVVSLGTGHPSAGGGDFLLVDARRGRKARTRRIASAVGDGALLCARERLVAVGGALGLQPVWHGLAGMRPLSTWLELPFHEHG